MNERIKLKTIEEVKRKERLDLLRSLPMPTWNRDAFMSVASDRGYRTHSAICMVLSEYLECSRIKVNKMLNTGRMTWGEVLCIGAFLEMTPTEFCEVFLDGYFRKAATDVFRANIENKVILLRQPLPRRKIHNDEWHIIGEYDKRPRRHTPYLVTRTDDKVDIASWDLRNGYPVTRMFWTNHNGKDIEVKAWKEGAVHPCLRKGKTNGDK